MKRALLSILFSYVFGLVFSQQQGDYRSDQNGNWGASTTWQVFFNGAWTNLETAAAGPFRNVIPSSASLVITVRNTVAVNVNTTANQLVVDATGVLNITGGRTLTIQDDGVNTPLQIVANGRLANSGTLDLQTQMISVPCQIFGTLSSSSTILASNSLLLIFQPGSTYLHSHRTGGRIPSATWDLTSTCRIAGLTRNKPTTPGNLGQSFGNFEWNAPTMGAHTGFSLGGALQDVRGNFTFVASGTAVRLGNIGPGVNLTIGGNLNMQGGSLILAQSLTSTSTITVTGNLAISGGNLTLGIVNNAAINVLLNGNLVKTGGNLVRGSGAGAGTIRFDGATQTYSNNADITSAVNFSVQSGSTLDLGTSALTGTGAFTLLTGGTLHVGSTDAGGAIQLGIAGGNIRMSGVRTYQTGTTVVYNGVAAQFMSGGHPAPSNTTLSNANGVTLVSNVAFNGNLALNGPFNTQQFTVTFGGGSKTISGTNAVTFYDMAITQTAASTVALTTNVDITNSLDINSLTTLVAGTERLRLLSTPARTANVLALAPGASITGSVIVQRHLPKAIVRKDFFHLASPVQNSNLTDWDAEIPMDLAYRYDEPTAEYISIPLTSNTPSGQGFTVRVGGPAITMDSRGTLGQGIVPIILTAQSPDVEGDDGWNLIGNPYPSAIDWDNVALPAGVYNAVYVWDNFGNSGQGTEPDQIVSYVDDVGTPAGYGGQIAQGQGFWVKATADATLTFTEAAKSTVTDAALYRKREIPNVLRIVINGEEGKDETVVRLREGATDQFDRQFDAYKYLAKDFNISTLTTDNVKAVINAFGTSSCERIVPIVTEGVKNGTYTFNFAGMESFDPFINIYLLDQVEKSKIDIRDQVNYSFSVTDENLNLMPQRFQLSMTASSPSVNVNILAKGETLCEDSDVARITLETSEAGVEYSAQWNGIKISESKRGTGSSIELVVTTESLSIGENNVTVTAQAGVCSMTTLAVKPTITKVRLGEAISIGEGNACEGGSATLRVSGADHSGWYHWYEEGDDLEAIAGQQGAEFVTPALVKSKTYYVAVVNALGCEGNRIPVKAVVSHPREQVTLTAQGYTLLSNTKTGNQWYLDGNLLEGETSNILQALVPGLYTVIVKDGACASTASLDITDSEGDVGEVRVFPNPTKEKVYIRVKTTDTNATATIVSNYGVEIDKKVLVGENGIKEAEFDLLPYATGIYNVRVSNGQKVVVKRIAKIK